MRFQYSQEQIDYYSSLPREVTEYFISMSSNTPADQLPPGTPQITSLEDFDRVIRETHEVVSILVSKYQLLVGTLCPVARARGRTPTRCHPDLPTHLGFGIRYWLSHCLGKDGYYNFDFIDQSGERINTPPGVRLLMEYNFHVRSTLDLQLARKLQDPASYGIDPNAKLPPACEVFVIYCGRPHILELNGKEVYRFQPPEVKKSSLS
ncbi:hypothetical protein VKT23_014940 [Stygiomarasmius scandens]|uniref:Uncharacterized protein n=1 Tax=Marasmiellus scandens TaxID=2682957 RepID=A0ABR1J3F6_9AGAR